MELVEIAREGDLPDQGVLVVQVGGMEIAVFRCSDGLHALENVCPHRGGPLAEGEFKEGIVSCPWHAWTFDVRSGLCMINPSAKVRKFEVRLQGDRVLLAWDG